MFEGFDLTGCVRVEVLRYGFVRETEVSVVTLRVHLTDGGWRDEVADLGAYGLNYEALDALVRLLNAPSAASPRRAPSARRRPGGG